MKFFVRFEIARFFLENLKKIFFCQISIFGSIRWHKTRVMLKIIYFKEPNNNNNNNHKNSTQRISQI
jgi:DUF1365 family protein